MEKRRCVRIDVVLGTEHWPHGTLLAPMLFVVRCSISDGRLHCCRRLESSVDNFSSSGFWKYVVALFWVLVVL